MRLRGLGVIARGKYGEATVEGEKLKDFYGVCIS